MGVRGVVSTWAFLQGLVESKIGAPKCLYCVDIADAPGIDGAIAVAEMSGIEMRFFKEDSAKVVLPKKVDMLFIDTWHVYAHLKRELEQHHANVKDYIVMHDTEVDGIYGESIRCGLEMAQQSQESGYPIEEIGKGLKPAVEEFLQSHPQWTMHREYKNNNGLTILKRRVLL